MPDFKLSDIVEKERNKNISLPTVQRGFVWKPYQIENLWDSLLRGYPIGSFVISPKVNSADEFELLDGQQRASAICLGFHNPSDQSGDADKTVSTFFRTSTANIMVFIDLAKPNGEYDNRKFLFRVITRSHPWGYRRQENQKTLESDNIAKAMRCYNLLNNYDYLLEPLDSFWPYDAYRPIPVGLFINAAINNRSLNELSLAIDKWRQGKSLTVASRQSDDKVNYYSVSAIYSAVQSMLANQRIPALLLDMETIYGGSENNTSLAQKTGHQDNELISADNEDNSAEHVEEAAHPNIEDRSIDEVENLFIRLNSGGTPLRGEELNYSILKAHISSELQTKIEERCKGLLYPARFITIAFRLFNLGKTRVTDKESITMKVKPKQFQRSIKAKKEEFIGFIEKAFLDTDTLGQFKSILSYEKTTNKAGLPAFIVTSLAEKAPEIVFMLLYRIVVKKDIIDDVLRKRVLGMITLFVWLGKGQKQKDHGKLLAAVWPCVRGLDAEKFWSHETIQRAMVPDDNGYQVLTPFPSYAKLLRLVPKGEDIRNLTRQKFADSESEYFDFISKIFNHKDLLLYAQRDSLFEWFHKIEGYQLDDTNRAFDWDHICPASAVRKKRNVHQALRDWYSSNGNMRAWPYSLNRSDQDSPPSDKLCCESEKEVAWWTTFCGCTTQREVNEYLLRSSFCVKEWLDLTSDVVKAKIKEVGVAKQVAYFILDRNIDLCKEWYNELGIDSFRYDTPTSKSLKEHLLTQLDSRMWNDDEKYEGDWYEHYLPLGKDNLYLYVGLDIEANTLKENHIRFGIWAYDKANDHELPLKVKVPKSLEETYLHEKSVVSGTFTLMSYSTSSLTSLLGEFYAWLGKFPDKEIRHIAMQKYADSIRKEYRDEVSGSGLGIQAS